MIIDSVNILHCKDKDEASKKAFGILLEEVDSNTLLLLSGGMSPDLLYQLIAKNKNLKPGAVALVDERFGLPMHDNSNEKMISDTGLLEYIRSTGIPYFQVLKTDNIEKDTIDYEQVIKNLFKKFPKKIAIMGIGADGHTAGIKPGLNYDHSKIVTAYMDAGGPFGKRITLTFEALEQVNEFIVLVFGEDKKEAFKRMPAIFSANNSAKVMILTTLVASSIFKE